MTRLAAITFLDEPGSPAYPGNALPGNPVYPSQGLPSPGYPTGGPVLPPGGATLPVYPFDPTDPGFGNTPIGGGRPDNSLPGVPGGPSVQPIRPGARFVVKYLACVGLILVPDNTLPGSPTAEPKK